MKLLHFTFLPRSVDAGLLVLRLWFGLAMLGLHGWGKVANFSQYAPQFVDPFGLGKTPSLALATFAELVCAGLIALGLFTRFSALLLGITMGVAFWMGHGGRLTGEGNGEMAFLYLGTCVALFVSGAGKLSVDAKLGVK